MKTKYLSVAIVLLMLLIVSSCKKDQSETTSSINTNNKILKFKSVDELNKSTSAVLKMTPEQRKSWAAGKGFESFGVKCDELYSNSQLESFTSLEQFKKLVADNSEFLYLDKMDDGELSLETRIDQSPFRYFANLEKIYQIEDRAYKVLEKGTVSANVKNIEKLKLINDENYLSICAKNVDLQYSNSSQLNQYKSTMSFGCGFQCNDYQSSGNDRTYLYIDTYPENFYNPSGVAFSRNVFHYQVKAKRRSIVWIWCSRTMSFALSSAKAGRSVNSYNGGYTLQYDYFSLPVRTEFTNNLEDIIPGIGCEGTWYNINIMGFDGYHCWGETPSAPRVNFNCGV